MTLTKEYIEKEYYGYHKHKRLVGPVTYEKMQYWKHIIRLRWTVRGKRI